MLDHELALHWLLQFVRQTVIKACADALRVRQNWADSKEACCSPPIVAVMESVARSVVKACADAMHFTGTAGDVPPFMGSVSTMKM